MRIIPGNPGGEDWWVRRFGEDPLWGKPRK